MYFLNLAIGVLLVLGAFVPPSFLPAASAERCFPETGHCISGTIRAYWESHGGLQVFGYPISDVTIEQVEGTWTGPVQWFERDRLEDHSADGHGVLAGRLGAWMLELQERRWEEAPRIDQAPADCRYFPQTGHSLCGLFLHTWQSNGGLERFGYPLTEPMEETLVAGDLVWTGTVQYFERRRMEHHLELVGTPYEVLFGLLGQDIFAYTKALRCSQAPSPLAALAQERGYSCAASLPRLRIPIAVQPFEGGTMIWVPHPAGKPGSIYVLFRDLASGGLVWQQHLDDWHEGMPPPDRPAPPPGRYVPERGFGLLWSTNATLRSALGWATAPEQGDRGDIQRFYVNSGVNRLTIIASSQRRYLLHEGSFPADQHDTVEILEW